MILFWFRSLQAFANGAPSVLAGDFNFTPDSPMYRMVTTGSVVASDPALPPPLFPTDSWSPTISTPLTSAHVLFMGKEPDFTNHSETNMNKFTGTLDYIFVSPGVGVCGVDALPVLTVDTPTQPSEREPSDHLPVAANLTVPYIVSH